MFLPSSGKDFNCRGHLIVKKWQQKQMYFYASLNRFNMMRVNFTGQSLHQCIIGNRNMHKSVLNGGLGDIGQVPCGICELGLFAGSIAAYFIVAWIIYANQSRKSTVRTVVIIHGNQNKTACILCDMGLYHFNSLALGRFQTNFR